jgi:DNA-binding transcriptional LysR family regulator
MVEGIHKCPDVEYRIVEREDSEISNRVLSGEVELGITSIQVKNSQLVYEPCFIEEIVLITPNTEYYREMSLEKLKRILVNDGYVRFDFGGGSDYLWNDFFGKILGCDLHEIRTVARCSNYNITLKTVEQGMGIAFISNTVIREEVLSEKILAYRFSSLLQKQFYLVYHKERIALTSGAGYRSKELLMQEIQKHFDSMNEKIIDKYDREFQPFSKLVGL